MPETNDREPVPTAVPRGRQARARGGPFLPVALPPSARKHARAGARALARANLTTPARKAPRKTQNDCPASRLPRARCAGRGPRGIRR